MLKNKYVKFLKGTTMKLKMIIGTLVATLSTSVFAAAPTTTAFTNFMNNVSSDLSKVNNAQSAQNNSYNEFNRQLVITVKCKLKRDHLRSLKLHHYC